MHERYEEMIALREQGLSYAEIGKRFHYSKQRVYQIIGGADIRYFKPITEKQCVYVGIRNWMNENKVNRTQLIRKIWGYTEPELHHRLNLTLRGCDCRKNMIDKLLSATGLTYEEAFMREDETNAE